VEEELARAQWRPHLKLDLGLLALSPIDWVDQAGDYGTL